jgi:hypothetical protein
VAPRRKASAKRAPGQVKHVHPLAWFYRPVRLPYRPSREVEETIREAVDRLT